MQTLPHIQGISSIGLALKFGAICPIPKLPYGGTIEIEYMPRKLLVELESVQEWVKTIDEGTVEDICAIVFEGFEKAVSPNFLRVTVRAESTGHGKVVVEKVKIWEETPEIQGEKVAALGGVPVPKGWNVCHDCLGARGHHYGREGTWKYCERCSGAGGFWDPCTKSS